MNEAFSFLPYFLLCSARYINTKALQAEASRAFIVVKI
jgi:hypothetical protein